MPILISPQEVPTLLNPGQNVFIQGANGEPTALLEALEAAGDAISSVNYVGVFPAGFNAWDPASFAQGNSMTAFFATAQIAGSVARGVTRLIPAHYSSIDHYLRYDAALDVLLIQVAPPDESGMCSLGVAVDFVPELLERPVRVIAEINAAMPVAKGSPAIAYERIDHAVEVSHPLIGPEGPEKAPVVDALSRNVASLVRDGDTIETGVGKLPGAILAALRDRNDLGFHSGLMSPPVLELIQRGNINGNRKPIDKGLAVTGIAFGSQEFYRAIAARGDVAFRPVSYTHDAGVLRQLDNFVAINSAVEVDLLGQANGEFVKGRQVSGTGGLIDFMRGAQLARNGRSIIALPSRAGHDGPSRIVARVDVVTCARSDIDFVVTEHGIANLRNKGAQARAQELIAIAAPEFRDELARSGTV